MVNESRILMAQSIVILTPDMRAKEIIEGSDRPPPRNLVAGLEPLGVLIEHRVDDVDEGFIAREEAVPAGQQIALQPTLALVFTEHLHHAAIRTELVVLRIDLGHIAARRDIE